MQQCGKSRKARLRDATIWLKQESYVERCNNVVKAGRFWVERCNNVVKAGRLG